jgi:hypothetical protein
MKDGSTECVVSGRYEDPRATSIELCSREAAADIQNVLLESGKKGWTEGLCFDQEVYSRVIPRAVEFLESKGYKVKFIAYRG